MKVSVKDKREGSEKKMKSYYNGRHERDTFKCKNDKNRYNWRMRTKVVDIINPGKRLR